ncbi:MAG: hypothetical protein LBK72_07500 [Bifidobacteriaceae bacterium]|jgi:hypothetical protein|nr:hypothetical protein [Bifidobacteriaceae bacterium]
MSPFTRHFFASCAGFGLVVAGSPALATPAVAATMDDAGPSLAYLASQEDPAPTPGEDSGLVSRDDAAPTPPADAAPPEDTTPPPDAGSPAASATAGLVEAPPVSGTSTTNPAFDFEYRLPTLDGVSPELATAFNKRVTAIVTAAETALTKAKPCKDKERKNPATGELSITYDGAIYAGRYASVTLLIDRARPRCSNLDYVVPSSFTLDLTTRKPVKMSAFVYANGQQFDSAVVASMRTKKQNPDCYKDSKLRKIRPPLTTPHGWNVTDSGVRVFYRGTAEVGAACSYLTAFVPWSSVADPASIKDKKTRTTYWVMDLKKSEGSRYGYTGRVAEVRTRGDQVAIFEWNLSKASGSCQVGVRDGKTAIVFAAGKATPGKKVSLNNATAKSVPKKYVTAGRKATKAEVESIFTRTHGLNTKAVTKACRL